MRTFKEAWKIKEQEGYQYGEDALEQVEVGWDLAITEIARWLHTDPYEHPSDPSLLPNEIADIIARRKTER